MIIEVMVATSGFSLIYGFLGLLTLLFGANKRDRKTFMLLSGWPGVGQMINGEIYKGIFLLISWIACWLFGIIEMLSRHSNDNFLLIDLVLLTGLIAYGYSDAVYIGYPQKNEYKLSKYKEEELQKVLWGNNKINGESGFKPLPDKDPKSKEDED